MRTYSCSDHRLLYMVQHINRMLYDYPALVQASGINGQTIQGFADAAIAIHPSLNTYSPGGRVVYGDKAQEEKVVFQLNQLWEQIERLRHASALLPVKSPHDAVIRLWSELEHPGEHVLEPIDLEDKARAEYVVYADLRHQISYADFHSGLALMAQFPALKLAALFYNDLSDTEIKGLNIEQHSQLRGLNLNHNQMSCVPFTSDTLEFLGLAGNPLRTPPDVRTFPALRWLDLTSTLISRDKVTALRADHPHIQIWY